VDKDQCEIGRALRRREKWPCKRSLSAVLNAQISVRKFIGKNETDSWRAFFHGPAAPYVMRYTFLGWLIKTDSIVITD